MLVNRLRHWLNIKPTAAYDTGSTSNQRLDNAASLLEYVANVYVILTARGVTLDVRI